MLKGDVVCLACGLDLPALRGFVDLAHVTPLHKFRDALGDVEGTRHSFRPENLVPLCWACHAAQETGDVDGTSTLITSARLKQLLEEQRKEHEGKPIAEILDFPRRQQQVRAVFDDVFAKRGWRTVEEFAARASLGPIKAPKPGPTFLPVESRSLPPEGVPPVKHELTILGQCVNVEGGRVLRRGKASDFVPWYEHESKQPYLFKNLLDAPALILHRPVEESLVGKIQRRFALANLGVVRHLKVTDRLYLLQVHPEWP